MKKNIIILLLIITGNLFAQMPSTLSKSEKIYGLSKFWQEVNYNFVYLYKIDREKWKNEKRTIMYKLKKRNCNMNQT